MTLVKIYIFYCYYYYFFSPCFQRPPVDDGAPNICLCCPCPGPTLSTRSTAVNHVWFWRMRVWSDQGSIVFPCDLPVTYVTSFQHFSTRTHKLEFVFPGKIS